MTIHATSVIDPGAEIASGVTIGPYCIVGAGVRLHEGVVLHAHVVVSGRTQIGARTVVHPFAVLGGPPQHLGYRGEDTALEIGSDNLIREAVTMNRGTIAGRGVTRIGSNGFFMAGAHVAHDCVVGDRVICANAATLGGHVEVGEGAFLGGLSAVHQYCRIGAFAFVGGCAAVTEDIIPYASAVGNRAELGGLNIIGLKRRGTSAEVMRDLRLAYRDLFHGEGVFADRLERVAQTFAHQSEVQRIIDFIRVDKRRPLMGPRRARTH